MKIYFFAILSIAVTYYQQAIWQNMAYPNSNQEHKTSSNALPIEDDEIVVEGTIISSKEQKTCSFLGFCTIEVHKIFNGTLNDDTIIIFISDEYLGNYPIGTCLSGRQQYMPMSKVPVLFRIKGLVKNSYCNLHQKLNGRDIYEGTYQYLYHELNIEKNIYKELEKKYYTNRKQVLAPATQNEIAIQYSLQNNLELPNRKKGIVYELAPIDDIEASNTIGFYISFLSANDVVSLHKGQIIIQYNEKSLGKYIVKNKRLKFKHSNISLKKSIRSAHIPTLPLSFEVTVKDIAPNKLRIEWQNMATPDSCFQLLPLQRHGYVGVFLYFEPIKLNEPIGLELQADVKQNIYYDHTQARLLPFEYVAVQKIDTYTTKELMPARITDIIPNKNVVAFDTIQLIGSHFLPKVKVALNAKAGMYYRYQYIADKYIIQISDTMLTFIVPDTILAGITKHAKIETWYPTKGNIQITKGVAPFEINSWSKKGIYINDIPPPK